MSSDLFDASEYLTYIPECIDPTLSTGLWFVEDAICVSTISINAVCLPFGGDWSDLDKCAEFFGAFRYIVIAIPNEKLRAEVTEQLQRHVRSVPITVVQTAGFQGKSIPEIYKAGGRDAIMRLLGDCVDLPGYGLLNIADVKYPPKTPRLRSSIAELDRATGGSADGELTVLTGRTGEGKSTFVGQVLLTAREQGRTVCAYSGELPAWRFREWLYLQAAGPSYVQKCTDRDTGREYYTVPKQIQEEIDAWLGKRFFLLDSSMPDANDPKQILSAFYFARRQNDATVFLVDNLMSAEISTTGDRDFYRAQSAFVGRLVAFCKATGAQVYLVSHPRKTDGKRSLDADDISGTKEIVNRADNAISLERLSDEDAARQGFSTMLTVLKNRQFGSRAKIGLVFDEPSRRFSGRTVDAIKHRYPWDTSFTEDYSEEPTPFDELPKRHNASRRGKPEENKQPAAKSCSSGKDQDSEYLQAIIGGSEVTDYSAYNKRNAVDPLKQGVKGK